MNETKVKQLIVKSMKDHGGYGRRIEDQYAVGTYDMILIPKGLPLFAAEVKIIRGNVFGPTPRQMIELQRLVDAADDNGHVIPVMIGWQDGTFYFHKPKLHIDKRDCFSITQSEHPFYKQLVLYYYSLKGAK
jgi:hypothetical protein